MLPVFDVGGPILWLKDLAINFAKWLAFRGLMIALFTTLIPLAIYAGWKLINEQIFNYVLSHTGSVESFGALVELTGLAAWLGDLLRFQECFAVLASAMLFRFVLSFIKR
ncbi:MAG: hypothetical protein NDI81_01150 [Desulfobacula sp.]|nr:hypothetical protein [Desulfobacula sp.]